mmetsp:Transcript_8198/g.12574  ORF Transcript_8198/g.12574 Transcript_8198/m.12574 type:complete len:87 (+) Transcript_8198:899-1159(+)
MDSKVCPKNISYVLKVVKYIIPGSQKQSQIRFFPNDAAPEKGTLKTLFSEEKYRRENVVLQLLNFDENDVRVVKEVPILKAYLVNI